MRAVKISGRSPDARFAFINETYEPMQTEHNGKPCFVARSVAPRYLFHTGKARWVISKVLDDGYQCWAFVKAAESSQSPMDARGSWTVCDADDQWREDPKIQCVGVPACNDKFVQLRMTLDGDMKKYGLIERSDLKKLWRRLDYNGNNVVSLAEIDKLVVDLVSGGVWPNWLNNKPALMRAYKKTTLKDGDGDSWVEKKEFHALLLNIFWFNKLWQIFDNVDTGNDRRMDINEFMAGMNRLGLNMSPAEAQQEFNKIDTNRGGQVLFTELCAWVRKRVNPDSNPDFDADIVSGENSAKASYNTVHSSTVHSRGLDFSAMGASGGGAMQTSGGGGGGGGFTKARSDAIRRLGNKATQETHVKQKCFKDFDDLEAKIKALCADHASIKKMWHTLDFNGNGVVSLAEIDKWVVENYPLLNHKPALMRCYKQTMERKDEFVHAREFKKLIVNLFYFNKLYWIFDQCNGEDRRMNLNEFKMCLSLCNCQVSDSEAQADFRNCDKNGGGVILFDEFCHYFASKACPQGMTDMTDDGIDRTQYDGTGGTVTGRPVTYHFHGNY
mmetsp:Transcript_66055/g.157959  ORF Transcript_66055/g.157959 Transcript_66055/m.157959 type:complete len:556 (+) Transcript_66055:96-1763(+)